MRVGIIGGGSIARLFLERARRGDLDGYTVAAVLGRAASARARALAQEHGVAYATDLAGLLRERPDIVVEAAGHDAVREYAASLLGQGVSLIVLSAGALCDDALRGRIEQAALRGGAQMHVPSGGIGGLDALKAACLAGVDTVTINVRKPPAAWKGIPGVAALGVDLDALDAPFVLYDGPAREGVPLFPQNVNIAAVLSLAGIGFDRTRLKVTAEPGLRTNTHVIEVRGAAGRFVVTLENVPAPDNPKTAWLACYSALAALKGMRAPVRYGT